MDRRPLAVFDSGVGGLSILAEIRRSLPSENVLYFADQAHVPYGARPLEEIQAFSVAITDYLLAQGAKLMVVACNTASAAALQHLRAVFPGVSFVGMEPAVKPAARTTRSGRVGVLATPATFQGRLFASVVERFASGVRVYEHTLPGLVDEIEAGNLNGPEVRSILEAAVVPLLEAGVDTLVLACTHYPFVIPMIEEIAAGRLEVIDPSPAIARQAARLLREQELESVSPAAGSVTFISTGDPERLVAQSRRLIGVDGPARRAVWRGLALEAATVST